MEIEKSSFNTSLRVEQSYSEKVKYFYSILSLLEALVSMDPVILTRKPDKRTGKIYKCIYFITLAFPCLNEFYDLFYKDKIKIIPYNFDELLTPVGLAYLIMDDGGKTFYNQTVLHTRAFSKTEVLYIMKVL